MRRRYAGRRSQVNARHRRVDARTARKATCTCRTLPHRRGRAMKGSVFLPDIPDIRLVDLQKRFGSFTAVDGISLDVRAGEFFTMLGPSGSGKTTTLRLIAGFERPDAGRVELSGADVAARPPYERDVNTVFQDYALFPHMTVLDNVAYGLKVRRLAKGDRRAQAQEALELV